MTHITIMVHTRYGTHLLWHTPTKDTDYNDDDGCSYVLVCDICCTATLLLNDRNVLLLMTSIWL